MSRASARRRFDRRPGDRYPGRAGLSPLDSWLERVYRARGPRLFLGYVALGWLLLLIFGGIAIAVVARFERLSVGDALRLFGLELVIWVIGVVISLWGCHRRMAPIFEFERDRVGSDALAAWRVARRLPLDAVRLSCVVAVGICLPPSVAAGAAILPLDLPIVLVLMICVVAATALVASGGVFGAQLAVRPMVRDLARNIDEVPLPDVSTSVGFKLRLAVPAVTVATAALSVVIAAEPGTDHWKLLTGVMFAIGGAGLLSIVIAKLLAVSLLQPLADLLDATRRLKAGDFATPVPDLSADEYGVLACSFNEAMEGLAERQHLAGEVRASRARIVAASDAERRRIERNIHDGAQQRLMAVALDLRMLADAAGSRGADDLSAMANSSLTSLTGALEELRELARGLHPSVLTTDGLAPALTQLASLAPLPVSIETTPERFPEPIESTAYFVACEALTNIAKYAEASQAAISVLSHDGQLRVEVSDDGVGGADPTSGSGLAGLADRVEALDGRLLVDSPDGIGTRVVAELPLTARVA